MRATTQFNKDQSTWKTKTNPVPVLGNSSEESVHDDIRDDIREDIREDTFEKRLYWRFDIPKTIILHSPNYSVRLDVAGPHNAICNRWFNTAVCVKTPNSPALKQEGLQNIVSKMGDVLNYDPKLGVKLKIEPLPSSDFDFQPNCFTFFLHHNLDSEIFFFSIRPQRIGTVMVMFCLSQVDEGFAIASQPLFITVEMPIEVRPTDQSHSMQGFAKGISDLQLALSESESRVRIDILNILDHKFVLSEIKELLFNLGLDMENYAGSTRREKIIEIILH